MLAVSNPRSPSDRFSGFWCSAVTFDLDWRLRLRHHPSGSMPHFRHA